MRCIVYEIVWSYDQQIFRAQKLLIDPASEKALCRLQVVGIGLKEELGLEYEGWVEIEKKEQRGSLRGGGNFIPGTGGRMLPGLSCLTQRGAE